MKATLTYLDHRGEPLASFELVSPTTVVGRGPPEALGLPAVAEKVRNREPFQYLSEDTLFIGIPDVRLARKHFLICRAVDDSGRVSFVIRDLDTHCGFMLNGVRQRSAEVQLRNGDRIHYGFEFTFSQE